MNGEEGASGIGPESPFGDIQQNLLPHVWADDIAPQLNGQWLIKGLLPSNGLALVYGSPGSGKSFLTVDFAMNVALARAWRGRKTLGGLVIYIAAEGATGLKNRIAAWKIHHRVTEIVPLVMVTTAIDLGNANNGDLDRLRALIDAAVIKAELPLALLVIDTLSKTFGGGDENGSDMAAYVANCGRLASDYACCTMPVHHRPKNVENVTPRGHGSLTGGVDTILLVSDQGGCIGYKQVEVTKQKEGETGELIGVHLLVVELGVDDDGDTVTSCVVEEADAAGLKPVGKVGPKKSPYSDNQQLAIKALKAAIKQHGTPPPDGIPAAMLASGAVHDVVTKGAWLEAYLAAGGGDDKTPESAKSGFYRIATDPEARNATGQHLGVVWVADMLLG